MKSLTIKRCAIKSRPFKLHLGALALMLSLGAVTAPSAMAYKVYQLEDKYYAIVCADGQIFSYSGGAGGLSTVGPALCEKHGGVAGGGGDGRPQVERAPADVAQIGKRCEQAGRDVREGVKQCPGKVRVRRDAPNAAPQQAPAQDYNSSRSNKPST